MASRAGSGSIAARQAPGRCLAQAELLHDAVQVAANVVQLAERDQRLQRVFQRLQRVAAVLAALGDVVRHGRPAGEDNVVGDGQVRRDDRVAAGHEPLTDRGRARHHEAGGVEAVLAEIAVVGDVADVVDLRAGADVGRGQGATVDRAVAADLDGIADRDDAKVRNLLRAAAGADRVAEAVAADGGVRMDLAVFADDAARPYKDVRVQCRARTDARVVFDDRMRADATALADRRPGTDHAVRAEQHVPADHGRLVHHGRRVAIAPLREPRALGVERRQQGGHRHRYGGDGEQATDRRRHGLDRDLELAARNDDGGARRPDRGQLLEIGDEDEAAGRRVLGQSAVAGGGIEVPGHEHELVGRLVGDGSGGQHGHSGRDQGKQVAAAAGAVTVATGAMTVTADVTRPEKSSQRCSGKS